MSYSIYAPNTTQLPNVLFDYWMRKLSRFEFNCLMYIARKTFGWHKTRDKIAYSQFCEAVNASRSSVIRALNSLVSLGLIKREHSYKADGDMDACEYEINVIEPDEKDQKQTIGGITSDTTPRVMGDTTPVSPVTPTKSNNVSFSNTKGIDLDNDLECLPCKQGKRDVEKKTKHLTKPQYKPPTSKYPLKKEQIPVFEAMKKLELECDDAMLFMLIRSNWCSPQRIWDCIHHLERQIEKKTVFKKSRIAFFRHCLDGKQCLVTARSLENASFAKDFALANNWTSLKINDKYVECIVTGKQIETNVPIEAFWKELERLYDLSSSYGG
jgi:phage replication O-like protein O